MNWDLPSEAQQNELLSLTTVWKSQKQISKNYGIVLSLFNEDGENVVKYFFINSTHPTSARRDGYQYVERHTFNVPYLKPGFYYYKIGLLDRELGIFGYSYDGVVLGNLTIIENQNIKPCGLIVLSVKPLSPAEKAGVKEGDVVVGINGKKLEFETVNAENMPTRVILRNQIIDLKEFELNTENKNYGIVKKANEEIGLVLRFKFCGK